MSKFSIVSVEGESYEGRQWGYEIRMDGHPFMRCWTGGTGPCWNLLLEGGHEEDETMHVCDLDELIAALQALRASDANRKNQERWA